MVNSSNLRIALSVSLLKIASSLDAFLALFRSKASFALAFSSASLYLLGDLTSLPDLVVYFGKLAGVSTIANSRSAGSNQSSGIVSSGPIHSRGCACSNQSATSSLFIPRALLASSGVIRPLTPGNLIAGLVGAGESSAPSSPVILGVLAATISSQSRSKDAVGDLEVELLLCGVLAPESGVGVREPPLNSAKPSAP